VESSSAKRADRENEAKRPGYEPSFSRSRNGEAGTTLVCTTIENIAARVKVVLLDDDEEGVRTSVVGVQLA
jgi:hypothetical protein